MPHTSFGPLITGPDAEFVAAAAAFLPTAEPVALDVARTRLGPETDGALVLALADAGDLLAARGFLRELSLRAWPVEIALALGPGLPSEEPLLEEVLPLAAGSFRLPGHAKGLTQWAAGIKPRRPFRAAATADIADQMRRTLLDQAPSLEPIINSLVLAANHDVTVLIGGETGTGKTFLARLIHDSSARADERFVVVPCGALAGGLVESELFGHVKGAFTGADADREGRFAAAAAGTLLLDEIDALPLEQQAKLLRVIETGDYEPVGSNTTRRSQTRVIAATNIILEDAVDEGRFREDLFYRLNVLHIELPALAERAGDILPFARAMVAKYAERFDKPIYRLTEEVALALESFSWPGNVRQLENTMQQAVLACPGPELTVAHLPPALRPGPRLAAKPAGPLVRQREQSERVAIQRALTEAGDCRAKAARALGVSRVTLYKKLKKYGLTTTTTPQPA